MNGYLEIANEHDVYPAEAFQVYWEFNIGVSADEIAKNDPIEYVNEFQDAYCGTGDTLFEWVREEFEFGICKSLDELTTEDGLRIGTYINEEDIYYGLARDMGYEGWSSTQGYIFRPV